MGVSLRLDDLGKRFRYEWIYRGLTAHIAAGERVALLGPNGSGKSTLMKTLSGQLTPSRGRLSYTAGGSPLPTDRIYRHLSYAAPYIELIEEFTLREAIDFHRQFKPLLTGLDTAALIELLDFGRSRNKEVRNFSSGMKQRLKLALACCTDSDLLLLDEPTTNLDAQGVRWYRALIERFGGERTIVVASNVAVDYEFCERRLAILDYKPAPRRRKRRVA